MNSELRIMCTGKIVQGSIDWDIAPLPMPEPPTDSNMLVSRYMNSITTLGTPTELWWDGFYAEVEGQPLAAMPTEYQCNGWWASRMPKRNQLQLSELEEARLEDEWKRGGM